MKKIIYGLMALLLVACGDDDEIKNIGTDFTAALDQLYPHARNVEWTSQYGYTVAEFWENGYEYDVWFGKDASWQMTSIDYESLGNLPASVQMAFMQCKFSQWQVEDAECYQMPSQTFYVLELETPGSMDMDLYIGADGTIIKAEAAMGQQILPNTTIY